jgi:hypothetical protein
MDIIQSSLQKKNNKSTGQIGNNHVINTTNKSLNQAEALTFGAGILHTASINSSNTLGNNLIGSSIANLGTIGGAGSSQNNTAQKNASTNINLKNQNSSAKDNKSAL